MDPDHALDVLATGLRERLVAEAGEAGGDAAAVRALVAREAAVLDAGARAVLADRVAELAFGLGPLEPLLRDPGFATEADLRHAIERLLAPLGRRADEAEPLCDARLPDGSRVNVVLPPLALDGPALTIRRFRRRGFSGEDLVANGTLTQPLLDSLARAVRERKTI